MISIASVHIGLDLDGVVANYYKLMKESMKKRGVILDDKTYRYDTLTRETYNELCLDEIATHAYKNLSPIKLAIQTIQLMKEEGDKIFFITSRPPETEQDTRDWLSKYNVPYDGLFITKEKQEVAKKLNLDIFVDDFPKFLDQLKGIVPSLYLFNQNWNVDFKGYQRVNGWRDLYNIVQGLR